MMEVNEGREVEEEALTGVHAMPCVGWVKENMSEEMIQPSLLSAPASQSPLRRGTYNVARPVDLIRQGMPEAIS